jgi:transcriptional regulator with XRE-family HTH domain
MITTLSIPNNVSTVQRMESQLGNYIVAAREQRGWNQTEFAARANIKRAHLAQIERGKIALPSGELRRRLAAALGVRHVDILVAAGELTGDEIPQEGVAPDAFPHDPVKRELVERLATLTASEAANVSNYVEFTLTLRTRTMSDVRI